ncbi:HD-GYP domain-containing protein [Xanthobacter agilis]|jgi:putative nucleotidyltransferase with HDIG domain|uniref:Nucleotidyltransferase with HDIG domain n=1 Tax=Xanthobacter agilis TaxID=47492 RepID=A0ABU0LBE0_XANAG|nr:HD domain-containing phosphohydrolase [Xanthobacter agilis]MDQ0504375.1 putative nucleotidyltransferase with HDIG domain [Xanthobacter agilis]
MRLPTYRSILLRVALAALSLAVAVGIVAFLVEMEIADGRVSDLAKRESAAFLTDARGALSTGADNTRASDLLNRFMSRRSAAGRVEADGLFIVAELYDKNQIKMAEYVVPGAEWAEMRLKNSRHQFPLTGVLHYERFTFDGLIFIQTMEPLFDQNGQLLGYFESVFQLSPERSGEIVKDTVTVVAVSSLSVLGTALVLLPIFVAFNRGVMDLSRQLLNANIDILTVLGSAIAKRDSDTHAHNYRVTILAIHLAEAMGLDAATIRQLVKGAFLHDVGKIAISDSILLKPGKLDAEEFAVMKTHVVHGLDILRSSIWLEDAADVVGGHHEKFDGSGYPVGLAGDAIPITARVFAIADVFDALTSRRPYKEPMPFAAAMDILHAGSGTHFDPRVLACFAAIAPDLHAHLTALGDQGVETELRHLVGRYFTSSTPGAVKSRHSTK